MTAHALGHLMCAVCANNGIQPEDTRAITICDGWALCGPCSQLIKLPNWLQRVARRRMLEIERGT